MTLKPPITTFGRPAAAASATTPTRSGPEGSAGCMAGLDGRCKQRDRLLRELLTEVEPLGVRQRHVDGAMVLRDLAVVARSLGLVAWCKRRPSMRSHGSDSSS